jgi:hypothetical protein
MIFAVLGFGLLAATGPVVAHHGFFGKVDLNTPITFEGVVTRVEWANPHISFYVDVTAPDGAVTNWRFEGAGPGALVTRGWTRTDLTSGMRVTVVGYRAKDGTFVAAARAVTLPDGRTLEAASDGVPPLKAK